MRCTPAGWWVFWLAIVGPTGCDCGAGGDGTDGPPAPDAGIDASPDRDAANPGRDAGLDGGADAGALPEECAGRPDFTRCVRATDPDRDYDICVDGACVSPGCGTADCNAPGPHFVLADTGQRDCYDAEGTAVHCAPLEDCQSLCGQDGQLGWDVGHAESERFARTSDPEPIVSDEVTGLVWQGCAVGTSGEACTGTPQTLLWADALVLCDGLVWADHDDWRLPDEYELHSILDYGRDGPAIDPVAFPATPTEWFLSSSTYAAIEDGFWASMWHGTGLWGVVVPKDDPLSAGVVRCVRDRAPPAGPVRRLTRALDVAGEPVVEDGVTGLAWQGCEVGITGDDCSQGALDPRDWASALEHCEGLEWGGATDWHLPDIKQLRSMIDNRRTSPGVDSVAFPGTPDLPAWTSTTNVVEPGTAWSVTIGFGGGVQDADKAAVLAVRCVRVP